MNQSVGLSEIQRTILEYLQGRDDAMVFGAQAVNAYVDLPRMSQDVDILSSDAKGLADRISMLLNEKLRIAVRIRELADGQAFRIYQVTKPTNRHLVDLRQIEKFPEGRRLQGILIPEPFELIAQKVVSYSRRSNTAKGMTDMADLRRLLLTFPQLKTEQGAVWERLQTTSSEEPMIAVIWHDLVELEIQPDDESDGY